MKFLQTVHSISLSLSVKLHIQSVFFLSFLGLALSKLEMVVVISLLLFAVWVIVGHVAVLTVTSRIVAFEGVHAVPSSFDLSILNATAFAHLLGVVDSVYMLALDVFHRSTHHATLTLSIWVQPSIKLISATKCGLAFSFGQNCWWPFVSLLMRFHFHRRLL